ncbi:MAG: hypothetical protein KC418_08595 [Anaerolineales bacterium]|nr:hypothetical protein [Anaerolineales bacterium]MCB8950940.1 hypothetical protein [Ardenticatenales bacterium]
MQRRIEQLGVIPYLAVGLILLAVGLLALNHLTTLWPFDAAQRIDLLRALAQDRADSAMLLEAALPEMIIAFLSLVLVSVTGLVLPLAYFLNQRFDLGHTHYLVALRQAMWLGVWAAFSVWLRMNRTMTVAAVLLVGAVLLLVELLLQVRARAAAEQHVLKEAK